LFNSATRGSVHLIRNSLAFVPWKDRNIITPDLKTIYRAETAEGGASSVATRRHRALLSGDWPAPAPRPRTRRTAVHLPPGDRKMSFTTKAGEPARPPAQDHRTRGSCHRHCCFWQSAMSPLRAWCIEWTAAVEQFASCSMTALKRQR